MSQKRLFLLSLGLGALLMAPAKAQSPGELAPKGTFAVVRISSLEWLEKAKAFFAQATGEDPEAMETPLLAEFHDLSGVDKGKPVYIFLVKTLQMTPWVALPMKDQAVFEKGMKLPAKPVVKGSYGLVSPASIMDGGIPEFGVPEVGDLPGTDLAFRILGEKALAAFQPQLMQIQMMGSMMAGMAAGGDQEKSKAVGKAINTFFDLVKGVKLLDMGFNLSDSGNVSLFLSSLPKEGTSLDSLVKALRPGTPPPVLGKDPLVWFFSAFPSTSTLPKGIQEMVQAIASMSGKDAKDPLAKAMGNSGSMAASITPEGRIVVGMVQKLEDPEAMKPYLASKEKLTELVKKLAPSSPMGGSGDDPIAAVIGLIKEGEFNPNAFELGGNPVASLAVPMAKLFKDAGADEAALGQKLLGGNKLHVLASVVGDKMVMGFGPEEVLKGIFQGLERTAALSTAGHTLAAGAFRLGYLGKALGNLMGKELPKEIKLSDLPTGEIRFSLNGDGKSLKGFLAGNLKEVFQVLKVLKKIQ